MKAALSVLVAFFAIAVVRAEYLFWAKLADDTTLSWDIPGAWKQVYSPWDFVNRLPTNADTIMLNSAATALAGEGIDEPHSLRITNGVAATALRVYVASSGDTEDSSYAKSGRVVGVQIENGGSLDAYEVSVGFNAAGYGVLTMLGGTLKASHDLFIGNQGIGVLTNWNGAIRPYGGCQGITIAEQAGSKGTYVMLGGSVSLTESGGQRNLFVGKYGEGRAEIHTDITVPYLKIGGSTDVTSRYTAYSATTTTVTQAVSIGGYAVWVSEQVGTIQLPGCGELVLSNAVLSSLAELSTTNFWIGRYDGAFGVLRGCGKVHGAQWNSNTLRIGLGNGQIIGDGFGEQRTLDMNTVVALYNERANPDDGTNGIYAVNKGAVKFPRVWFSAADASGSIGGDPKATPSLVNSVGYSVRGVQGVTGAGHDLRGGLYAADRTDVHMNTLPSSGDVVGVWRLGLFTDITGSTAKSFQNMDLTFRYDHTKVKPGQTLKLYRWTGTAWSCVATKEATSNPRMLCQGIAPQTVEGYNVGLFALTAYDRKGLMFIFR